MFLIFRPNGGVDGGFDTAIDASNLLADTNVQAAGYLFYRRIWTGKTETASTDIEDYTQVYDHYIIKSVENYQQQILSSPNFEWTPTVYVPPDIHVKAICNLKIESDASVSTNDTLINMIFNTGADFQQPKTSLQPLATQAYYLENPLRDGSEIIVTGNIYIITETNRTVRIKSHTSFPTNIQIKAAISILGWQDWRID